MTTHQKGAIGEHKVIADLIMKGFQVFSPLQESMPYDLIVNIRGFYHTVQVKYIKARKGYIESTPRRKTTGSDPNLMEYNKEFDILAIFCPDTNECYYIWEDQFNHSVRLRVDDVQKNSTSVRYAKDYLTL